LRKLTPARKNRKGCSAFRKKSEFYSRRGRVKGKGKGEGGQDTRWRQKRSRRRGGRAEGKNWGMKMVGGVQLQGWSAWPRREKNEGPRGRNKGPKHLRRSLRRAGRIIYHRIVMEDVKLRCSKGGGGRMIASNGETSPGTQ